MEAATYCSVKRRSRMCNVAMDRAAIHRTTVVSAAISVAPSRAIVARMAVVAVEPGTGADEHATDEVVRPIVAIRGAGVWIPTVVAVGTNRSGASGHSNGANPHADAYPDLSIRVGRGKDKNSKQCDVLEITHG
jgi:hypothetical protein